MRSIYTTEKTEDITVYKINQSKKQSVVQLKRKLGKHIKREMLESGMTLLARPREAEEGEEVTEWVLCTCGYQHKAWYTVQ